MSTPTGLRLSTRIHNASARAHMARVEAIAVSRAVDPQIGDWRVVALATALSRLAVARRIAVAAERHVGR